MFNLKLKDFEFNLKDFKLKSLLDIDYYKSTCNIMVVIFIIILLFFLTFAIKTRKRYLNIKNTLGEMNNTSIEAFSNMEQKNQQDIMDKLNIDEADVEIVKKKNKNKKKKSTEINSKVSNGDDDDDGDKLLGIMPNKIINIPQGDEYDKLYADAYDMVAMDHTKVMFEVKYIKSLMDKSKNNVILDVGCGTGQHTKYLSEDNEYIGLDKSTHMLDKAKLNINKKSRLVLEDANKLSAVGEDKFTVIMCMYFTIYYFKDPNKIFYNFTRWIKKDGILILHLVDKNKFDPILNPANPSHINSIQKYTDKRITSSIINFNNMTYISDFVFKKNNMAEFQEIIRFNKDNIERRQRHLLYMFSNKEYVKVAKKYGFQLQEIKSMNEIKYEHNYLFVFKKK